MLVCAIGKPPVRSTSARGGVHVSSLAKQRAADVDHEQQVGQPAADRQQRAEHASLGRRHHRRQQHPGAGVVNGGAGQRHRPQPGVEQS